MHQSSHVSFRDCITAKINYGGDNDYA